VSTSYDKLVHVIGALMKNRYLLLFQVMKNKLFFSLTVCEEKILSFTLCRIDFSAFHGFFVTNFFAKG